MGTVTILDTTTKQPITLIGERAGICWNADISNPEKNFKRGLDCIESGHGRTLEFVNIETILDGYSARVIREWYTHIGGAPTRLQASTRYINYGEFEYIMPKSIADNHEAVTEYKCVMRHIQDTAQFLELQCGIPREDVANILPLGMATRIVDKRNLRNLIDMSRQRTCTRALWEFRELFRDVSVALANYSDEWAQIVNKCFYPKCYETQTCPEKKSCGRFPKKVT